MPPSEPALERSSSRRPESASAGRRSRRKFRYRNGTMSQEETSMQSKSIKSTYRGLLARACFATLLVAGAAGSAFAADYAPVTDARLANPEPENWLMTRGNYKG